MLCCVAFCLCQLVALVWARPCNDLLGSAVLPIYLASPLHSHTLTPLMVFFVSLFFYSLQEYRLIETTLCCVTTAEYLPAVCSATLLSLSKYTFFNPNRQPSGYPLIYKRPTHPTSSHRLRLLTSGRIHTAILFFALFLHARHVFPCFNISPASLNLFLVSHSHRCSSQQPLHNLRILFTGATQLHDHFPHV